MKQGMNLDELKNQVALKAENQSTEKKPKTILDVIEENRSSIAEMLPKHVGSDKFIRTVLSAIRTNEKLKMCTPVSIMDGVRKAAQLGLDINTPLQQAYLIPYKKKKKKDGQWMEYYEAEFQYGYRGIIQMVWQSGMVKALDFDCLCEGDFVVYEKTQDGIKFSHKPVIKGKRGEPYAYYATAITKDGGFAVIVMSKEDIIAHAQRFSKNRDKDTGALTGTWADNFDAMALKTVIKSLADKKLPKSADKDAIMLQLQLDEKNTKINPDTKEIEYVITDDFEITDAEDDENGNENKTEVENNTQNMQGADNNPNNTGNNKGKVLEGQQRIV